MSDHEKSQNPYATPVDVSVSPGVAWAQTMSPSLKQTGVGLALVYYGILLMLLAIIVLVAAPFLARGGRLPINAFTMIIQAASVAIFIGAILNVIGPIVCLAVPSESGAKNLIVISVVFQLISSIGQVLTYFAPGVLLNGPYSSLLLNLMGFIGAVLFILFMKKLSHFINRHDLADRAVKVLVGGAIVFVLFVMWFASLLSGVVRTTDMMAIAILVISIVFLIVFVMYANLVGALRTALLKGR